MDAGLKKSLTDSKYTVMHLEELEAIGQRIGKTFLPSSPQPADIMTICYTSGTTGAPKGVIILHSTMIASVAGLLALLGFGPCFTNNPTRIKRKR